MTKKIVKLREKEITVYELKGFFGRPKITEQKTKFDQDCKTLLTVFAYLAKANELPKNSQEIIDWIGQSYTNCEATFIKRKPRAIVLDVNYLLEQVVKR